jgi:hypothetical protein
MASVDNQSGYINQRGEWAIKPGSLGSIYFSEGLAPFIGNAKWGNIDKSREFARMMSPLVFGGDYLRRPIKYCFASSFVQIRIRLKHSPATEAVVLQRLRLLLR